MIILFDKSYISSTSEWISESFPAQCQHRIDHFFFYSHSLEQTKKSIFDSKIGFPRFLLENNLKQMKNSSCVIVSNKTIHFVLNTNFGIWGQKILLLIQECQRHWLSLWIIRFIVHLHNIFRSCKVFKLFFLYS